MTGCWIMLSLGRQLVKSLKHVDELLLTAQNRFRVLINATL